jgi:uncharacterized protein YbgA (DUF1722 family)
MIMGQGKFHKFVGSKNKTKKEHNFVEEYRTGKLPIVKVQFA